MAKHQQKKSVVPPAPQDKKLSDFTQAIQENVADLWDLAHDHATLTGSSTEVTSISKDGSTPLTGVVTLSGGANVTLTQTGQEIIISSADTDTGITQLTGDVTAGPGSGAQAAVIATDAVTTTKILNGAVTNAKVASGIDAAKINTGVVSNTEFNTLDGVTSSIQTQLDSKAPTSRTITAGSGLSGGGDLSADRTLDVNVDGTTLEISADTIRVKASGIGANELASTTVTPGSYTYTGLTVDADGRITAASNGTAPASASSSVAAETSFGVSSSAGVASTYSKGDHTHGTPASPVTSIAKSGATALTGAVTLTGGTNITLTQVGQDISIAASGGSTSHREDYTVGTSASSYTGSTTVFDLSTTYSVGGDLVVVVDGVIMRKTSDYTETDSDTVTFGTALLTGQTVTFIWSIATSVSGVVNSGTSTHLAYYATSGATVSDAASATISGAYTLSGTITVSGQLIGKGTTTNDSAASGYIGECIESTVTTSTNFFGNTTFGDFASIVLTAGDWDVSGMMCTTANASNISYAYLFIGTVSGDNETGEVPGVNAARGASPAANGETSFSIPPVRISLAAGATYYLKGAAVYSSGTAKYRGARITARRVR